MLRNHDRRELRRIERQLEAEDPALARVMNSAHGRRARVWTILLVATDLAAVLMLFFGITGNDGERFVTGLLLTGFVVLAHSRRHPPKQSPEGQHPDTTG